jgi:hypothetical protein
MLPGTITSQRWQPQVSASYAVVAATLLGFALISSFYVNVTGRFKDLGDGPAPAPEMVRCLALSYRGIGSQRLPTSLHLTGKVSSEHTWGRPLYSAIIGFSGELEWRPAGPDSIDVTSYFQPMRMIRLPARGQHRVGRVAPKGYHTIWAAILAEPDGQVFASEVPCTPFLPYID